MLLQSFLLGPLLVFFLDLLVHGRPEIFAGAPQLLLLHGMSESTVLVTGFCCLLHCLLLFSNFLLFSQQHFLLRRHCIGHTQIESIGGGGKRSVFLGLFEVRLDCFHGVLGSYLVTLARPNISARNVAPARLFQRNSFAYLVDLVPMLIHEVSHVGSG